MSGNDALWYVADGRVELRPAGAPRAGEGDVVIRAAYSAISRGTERLVFRGRVPTSEYDRMRCPHQEGAFPFPVKYGYALTGEIVGGARHGEKVFALHPHQLTAVVKSADAHAVPAGVPLRRATLAANTETALNVVWDAGVSSGNRVLIVGAGVLGLLVAMVASGISGTMVTVADIDTSRAPIAAAMGARFASPADCPRDQDVVVHTSASDAGLALALRAAGFEAKVVEASWYGNRPVAVPLGEDFHARRLQLISSQVGSVAPSHRATWTHARRLAAALDLLKDARADQLITREIPFAQAAEVLPNVLADDSAGLGAVLRYP